MNSTSNKAPCDPIINDPVISEFTPKGTSQNMDIFNNRKVNFGCKNVIHDFKYISRG